MSRQPSLQRLLRAAIGIALILWLLAGCTAPVLAPTSAPPAVTLAPTPVPPTVPPAPSPTPAPPTATPAPSPVPTLTGLPTPTPTIAPRADGLSDAEAVTLSSLEKVDDHPLYTMHYHGAYNRKVSSAGGNWLVSADLPLLKPPARLPAWACSLFAALGDADNVLYGRNFDWEFSPALLLFTDPPDGYASASMVDIAYLGFGGTKAGTLTDLPLAERRPLLRAPFLPFDGLNEQGLAVGMAAVPPGDMRPDPGKETIGSLMVMRKILDQARDVREALAILQGYNVDMGGGPPVHYLIADPSGRAVLVEFYQGELVVISNEQPWHLATNFLRSSAGESAEGECWRYDRLSRRLAEAQGQMATPDAIDLLAEVSQGSTEWSVVYGLSTGDINVVMGRQYEEVHTFHIARDLSETLERTSK